MGRRQSSWSDVAPFNMPSLPCWYRSGNDWYAFLGVLAFHHFTWRVRRDHNAEWADDLRNARILHERRLANADAHLIAQP